MITYNDVYEAASKERYSEQLQKLSKSFIKDVAGYIREKKEIASKEDDAFSDVIVKTKKQLENATTLFKELITRRRKKILNLVLIAAETGISKQDFENMLGFEKELFEELMRCVDISDKKLNAILNGNNQGKQKNELVVFNEDVEEFVGLEGEKMGGFEKGQIVNLPKEIAEILIADGKAEKVEDN
ncbi:DNA replication complex GINS family protein [Candidatus Pacearchaeota archaeon]|nr:DNA replication complex GINS family protein [Candidatus Pacearchaeota archaeon]